LHDKAARKEERRNPSYLQRRGEKKGKTNTVLWRKRKGDKGIFHPGLYGKSIALSDGYRKNKEESFIQKEATSIGEKKEAVYRGVTSRSF